MAQKQTVTEAREVTVRVADCVWIGCGVTAVGFFALEVVTGVTTWGRLGLLAAMISLTAYMCSRYRLSSDRPEDFEEMINRASDIQLVRRTQNGERL